MTAMLLGLVVLLAAGFCIALLDLTIKRAEVGAALVFLSAITQAVFVYAVPSVRLGGMRVGVTDLVAVIVLTAAIARCMRLRKLSRYVRWLIVLSILLLVSLVLGIAQNGFQGSIGDSRQYVFFVGASLYMATFRPAPGLYDRIGRVWLMAAVLMIMLACIRWLGVFAGIHLGIPAESNGVDTAIRVLDGPYTFFLAGPLLLTVPFWLRRGQRRWIRWLGAVLLIVLLALDRRTVWLTMLVGVGVLLLRGRKLGPRTVMLVIAASIVIGFAFAGDVLGRDQAPVGSVTTTGSVSWRIEGWSDLVDSWSESPLNWLVGKPFGSGFEHTVDGQVINAQPHNFYIETMIRAGVGGLIAVLALTIGLLRRLWRVPTGRLKLFDAGMLPPLLAMQLTWYLTWIPGLEQGIVTGMAIAVAGAYARGGASSRLAPSRAGLPQPGQLRQMRASAGTVPPRSHTARPPRSAPVEVAVEGAAAAAASTANTRFVPANSDLPK